MYDPEIDVDRNNPAGRLHHILSNALSQPDNLTLEEVWFKVFEIENGPLSEIFPYIHKTNNTLNELKATLNKVDDKNYALFTKHLHRVDQFINTNNFSTIWGSIRSKLTEATLDSLAFCSAELSKMPDCESCIEEQELADLLKEVDELICTIVSASLNESLKLLLIKQLNQIRQAILEYKIVGIDSLSNAYASNLGTITINNSSFLNNKDTEEVQSYIRVLSKIDIFLSVALNIKALAPGAAAIMKQLSAFLVT
ncbi:hypothetical protein MNBD_DELTA01-1199 [hydrothermal vent metagenome]|uniref:Uncharacterized protein n=1 Tax=hydrothermal vent metagenome TaxID=652676 RepID=A0A3B0RL80_9ZZZZ